MEVLTTVITYAFFIAFTSQAASLMVRYMRKLLVFISFFLLLLQCEAQQYNTWYFGDGAGVSFNAGGTTLPYTLTDGINIANEGNASVCDANGNILFYTNGRTVYNRTHQVMLNGDNLLGDISQSATQGALIVPLPNNDSIYYIFTTGAGNDLANGYRYSIVNMKRDAGKGGVVTKNVLLFAFPTERLTAARHANGIDVWVIGNQNNSNTFMAWLMTCTGLQTSPVISSAGTILTGTGTKSMGMMKVSPDGRLLCQTQCVDCHPDNFFQLFDFDNATGVLSNARVISNPSFKYNSCEFSPDSKLLYVTFSNSLNFIDQFESKLGPAAAINASRVSIPAIDGFAGIQTGPDEKIYLNRRTTKLSVISYPNVKGIGCTFELDKIDLGNKNGKIGLPSAINDWPFDPYNNFTSQVIDSCNGIVQFNGQTNITSPLWYWDFGDGTSSTLQNPRHAFTPYNQPYHVKLTITSATACGYIERTKKIFPRGTFRKPGFDFVVRCDSGYVRFVNTSISLPDTGAVQYSWDFGDGNTSTQKNPVHSYAGSGMFAVKLKIKASKACLEDSISKNVNLQQLNIQAPPGKTIDPGQSVQLFVTGGGSRFRWSPSRWLTNPAIANPVARPQGDITYVVSVTDDAGCKDVDSVSIHVNFVDGIYMPTAFTPNNDGLNDIIRPVIKGIQYTLEEFSLFNRWGQKIFSTTETGKGWNGKLKGLLQDTGTYIWVITVTDAQEKIIIRKKGTVTLIR